MAADEDGERAPELPEELLEHCKRVAVAFANGEVVPFLGAGVNLCGRPKDAKFEIGKFLPSGGELAKYLARLSDYSAADANDLVRVSQYLETMEGDGPLYKRLREVFNADYRPTAMHDLLARLPKRLKELFGVERNQLIVTTNYDDALERAYVKAGQPFDVFAYVASRKTEGRFLHISAEGTREIIEEPESFSEQVLEKRPVLLKIHGAVDRLDGRYESYVITEDDYLDFLQHTELSSLIPNTLLPTLQTNHFLFLGYKLQDWNIRVILQRIWEEQEQRWKSWAVQHETTPLDQMFWMQRGVKIQIVDLIDYVRALEDALEKLAAGIQDAA
jgi:SIR2-like domain